MHTAARDAVCPCALKITGYDYIKALPSFQEGLFYVQDISSMLAAQAAAPGKDDFVLDVCAAPGGKATQAAAVMDGRGIIFCNDPEYKRVRALTEI